MRAAPNRKKNSKEKGCCRCKKSTHSSLKAPEGPRAGRRSGQLTASQAARAASSALSWSATGTPQHPQPLAQRRQGGEHDGAVRGQSVVVDADHLPGERSRGGLDGQGAVLRQGQRDELTGIDAVGRTQRGGDGCGVLVPDDIGREPAQRPYPPRASRPRRRGAGR
ncbi:hypothetical protein GCM10020000_40040 [Streptomyces olivoverticillatus]